MLANEWQATTVASTYIGHLANRSTIIDRSLFACTSLDEYQQSKHVFFDQQANYAHRRTQSESKIVRCFSHIKQLIHRSETWCYSRCAWESEEKRMPLCIRLANPYVDISLSSTRHQQCILNWAMVKKDDCKLASSLFSFFSLTGRKVSESNDPRGEPSQYDNSCSSPSRFSCRCYTRTRCWPSHRPVTFISSNLSFLLRQSWQREEREGLQNN